MGTSQAWVAGPTFVNTGTGLFQNVVTLLDDNLVESLYCTGAALSIGGLDHGRRERSLTIWAIGGDVTLTNADAGSLAANQILTPSGATVTIPQNTFAILKYDGVALVWRPMSIPA